MSNIETNVEQAVDTSTTSSEVETQAVETQEAAVEETVKQEATVTENVEAATQEAIKTSEETVAKSDNDFMSLLDEELRTSNALKDFKDVNSLAKSYLELNKFLGKRLEDMSSEELEAYYDKLGRPKSADEYDVGDLNGELTDWYKETAHKLGLNAKQAKALAEEYSAIEKAKIEEMETQKAALMNEWVSQIKEEFGSAFDERVQMAQNAVRTFGGEELKNFLNETGLGNHPAMVKAFAEIGKELGEDNIVNSENKGSFTLTPDEAQKKISMLKSDPDFMDRYLARGKYRKTSKEHKDAVTQIQNLYSLAFPS